MEMIKLLWAYHWLMPLVVIIAVIVTINFVLSITLFKDKVHSKHPDHFETGWNEYFDLENKAIQHRRRKASKQAMYGLVTLITCVYLLAHFLDQANFLR